MIFFTFCIYVSEEHPGKAFVQRVGSWNVA
jgi:hypothetical protein